MWAETGLLVLPGMRLADAYILMQVFCYELVVLVLPMGVS
jgi:hypothetical protein